MTLIELGRPLPDLCCRIAVGALNVYEIVLTDSGGGALDFTDVTITLEIGEEVITADLVGDVATFVIEDADRALIGSNTQLVITSAGERQIIADGRSVGA